MIPVEIACPECGKKSGFNVRMTRNGIKYDVYECDDGHITYIPVKEGETVDESN